MNEQGPQTPENRPSPERMAELKSAAQNGEIPQGDGSQHNIDQTAQELQGESARQHRIETRRNSDEVRDLNYEAHADVYGSQDKSIRVEPKNANPYNRTIKGKAGLLEDVKNNAEGYRDDEKYGKGQSERKAYADKYSEEFDGLVQDEGFEPTQAKLILDLREEAEDQERENRIKINNLSTKLMNRGVSEEDAVRRATTSVEKQNAGKEIEVNDDRRLEIVKSFGENGVFTRKDYDEAKKDFIEKGNDISVSDNKENLNDENNPDNPNEKSAQDEKDHSESDKNNKTESEGKENPTETTDLIIIVEEQDNETSKKGLFRRAWERAQIAVGNVATGNVSRRNVIAGAAAGLITAVAIQKLTGDHHTSAQVAGITPDNTLAAHDHQSFADVLRENGYQHPHQTINQLNDAGVLDNGGDLAKRLTGNPDHPQHMIVENFVDEKGAEGRMWVGNDLASVIPDQAIDSSGGLSALEAGAIGATVGGAGAYAATRSGENNARKNQSTETRGSQSRPALEERIAHLEETVQTQNSDRMILNRANRAMYDQLSDEQRQRVIERLQHEAQVAQDEEN